MSALPDAIGPYAITREIGRGGMGVVYFGRDTRLDRDVAIKALPEHLAQDPARLARFEREAKTLAQLNHPNVAGIYGVEEHEGARYLVLEYVEGETLATRLKRGALPVDEALEIAVQIAAGVEAAHEAGVIHRDLKPGNVIVTPGGKAKVLDFGLARAEDASSLTTDANSPTLTSPAQHSPTMPGVILGTAGYMSPEQARGRPVDKRTDIWSFGVILYEMLTGASPFLGETVSDSIGAVLHKEVNFDRLPRQTPEHVKSVMARCLSRDKLRRYRDLGDVRLDLEANAPPFTAPPVGRARRAHPAWIVVPVLALAGCVLIALKPDPTANREVIRFAIPMSDSATIGGNLPAISPDGSTLAYVMDGALWLRQMNSLAPRKLADNISIAAPIWSPDGHWVCFARERELLKAAVTGERIERIAIAPHEFGDGTGGAWLPDGRILFTTGAGGIYETRAAGGDVVELHAPPPGTLDYHDGCMMPDGNLLLTEHPESSEQRLVAWNGQTVKPVLSIEGSVIGTPAYSPTGHVLFARSWRNPGIWAVPFSLDELRASGSPFLIAKGGVQPSLAADGTLAYALDTTWGPDALALAWIDFDTGRVLRLPFDTIGAVYPQISPDGRSIAFSASSDQKTGRDLWVIALDSGVPNRLTFSGNYEGSIWSPDGSRLATTVSPAGSNNNQHLCSIQFLATDGSGPVGDDVEGLKPAFDSKWSVMVFERYSNQGRDIWIKTLGESGEARALIATEEDEFQPAISPNGEWLAYCAGEEGRIFLTRLPQVKGKWLVGQDASRPLPSWSEDGSRLYYVTTDGGLAEVELDLTDGIVISPPRRLFDAWRIGSNTWWGYYVDPAGQRALLPVAAASSEGRAFVVVKNWFEEFRGQ